MTTQTEQWSPALAITIALRQDQMTQKELAARLGWTEPKLSKCLNRDPERRQDLLFSEVVAISRIQGRPLSWYADGYSALNLDTGVYVGSDSRTLFDFITDDPEYIDLTLLERIPA